MRIDAITYYFPEFSLKYKKNSIFDNNLQNWQKKKILKKPPPPQSFQILDGNPFDTHA